MKSRKEKEAEMVKIDWENVVFVICRCPHCSAPSTVYPKDLLDSVQCRSCKGCFSWES